MFQLCMDVIHVSFRPNLTTFQSVQNERWISSIFQVSINMFWGSLFLSVFPVGSFCLYCFKFKTDFGYSTCLLFLTFQLCKDVVSVDANQGHTMSCISQCKFEDEFQIFVRYSSLSIKSLLFLFQSVYKHKSILLGSSLRLMLVIKNVIFFFFFFFFLQLCMYVINIKWWFSVIQDICNFFKVFINAVLVDLIQMFVWPSW